MENSASFVNVLDHGYVRLVSYMQPLASHIAGNKVNWTGDLEVIRNARVSYDADWRTGEDAEKDRKILEYMIDHKHTSPFEAMVFTFEVHCPIFVIRQWHRHRMWSYNELSARYAPMKELFYIPRKDYIGRQHPTNKQARWIVPGVWTEDDQWFCRTLQEHSEAGFRLYKESLDRGIPREIARLLIGLNVYSRYLATVDMHNLAHFLRLRADNHAQWEIQQYGWALIHLIRPLMPMTVKKMFGDDTPTAISWDGGQST